jgi:hypothetical protein
MRPTLERHLGRLRCGNARHGLPLAGFTGIVAPRGVRQYRAEGGAVCWISLRAPRPLAGWGGVYGAGMAIPPKQRDALRMLAGSPDGAARDAGSLAGAVSAPGLRFARALAAIGRGWPVSGASPSTTLPPVLATKRARW